MVVLNDLGKALLENGNCTAQELPPTAMPADVYLEKLEKLLHENARLRALLGEVLGTLRVADTTVRQYETDDTWANGAIQPVIDRLERLEMLK